MKILRHLEDGGKTRYIPDPVNRPVRTARTTVHYHNSTQYCSTETVLLIFPSFSPTSHLRFGQVKVRGKSGEKHFAYKHSPESQLPQLVVSAYRVAQIYRWGIIIWTTLYVPCL